MPINKPNVLKDIDAYPVLTEEVGFPPSPVSRPAGTPAGPPSTGLGQIASKAIADVLGWKLKDGDPKGFIGALTQSFTLTDIEGHVESKWTPRTYAVQSDLSGGITGAQASLYTRGKEAGDQCLPLIEGLYTLNTEADPEDVTAVKAVTKSQISELVGELGMLGGPRITRVNQYFTLLLGGTFPVPTYQNANVTPTDPDQVGGTLGKLRDVLGLNLTGQDFVNTVEDEQNLSNYRLVSDYITSLAQSWVNNLDYFNLNSTTVFYGTQLVLLSRQLSVVAESVDEVRFTLDSVFIGPAERQTLKINFSGDPPMFLEDLFNWFQSFATIEGPQLITDGGKFAVQNTFYPVVTRLLRMLKDVYSSSALNPGLPAGFYTARVQRSLHQLGDELQNLANMAQPIRHDVTAEPEIVLATTVTRIDPPTVSMAKLKQHYNAGKDLRLVVFGSGFNAPPPANSVTLLAGAAAVPSRQTYFRSQGCLVASFNPLALSVGVYDVTVVNADQTSAKLQGGFSVTLV